MVFSSLEFLFLFLPLLLGLYTLTPHGGRNAVLLAGSLLFYVWGGGAFVVLLLASAAVDYVAGRVVVDQPVGSARRRLGIALSVGVNLSLLGYFKYAGWIVDQFAHLGLGGVAWSEPLLPIGISFFTFQSMSYTFDIARGHARPIANPFDFLLYISLFPQLIAGPIVRWRSIEQQLGRRPITWDDRADGAVRFCHGLAKKVVVADSIAPIADAAFAAEPGELGIGMAWLGVTAYALQLYFDFSGYSDMAIGLGRLFGFRFPENFLHPYSAVSITDLWRRWHITLTTWIRDYVFVPLGGSRGSDRQTYVLLVFVFLMTGLWHGASWNMVIFGAYHGLLLLYERVRSTRQMERDRWWPLRQARVFLLALIGFVLFRAPDLGTAGMVYRAMVDVGSVSDPELVAAASPFAVAALLLASLVLVAPRDTPVGPWLTARSTPTVEVARFATVLAVFPATAVLVMSSTFSPFLYFQF